MYYDIKMGVAGHVVCRRLDRPSMTDRPGLTARLNTAYEENCNTICYFYAPAVGVARYVIVRVCAPCGHGMVEYAHGLYNMPTASRKRRLKGIGSICRTE